MVKEIGQDERICEMSNAKQKTIADIVADIRAQNQGLPEDSYALSPLVCDLLSFADRIEAAEKRADDQWRAALKPVLELEDNNSGLWPFASLAVGAVKEAQRIYKAAKYIEEGGVK